MRQAARDLAAHLHRVGVADLGAQLAGVGDVVDEGEHARRLAAGRRQRDRGDGQQAPPVADGDVVDLAPGARRAVGDLAPEVVEVGARAAGELGRRGGRLVLGPGEDAAGRGVPPARRALGPDLDQAHRGGLDEDPQPGLGVGDAARQRDAGQRGRRALGEEGEHLGVRVGGLGVARHRDDPADPPALGAQRRAQPRPVRPRPGALASVRLAGLGPARADDRVGPGVGDGAQRRRVPGDDGARRREDVAGALGDRGQDRRLVAQLGERHGRGEELVELAGQVLARAHRRARGVRHGGRGGVALLLALLLALVLGHRYRGLPEKRA